MAILGKAIDEAIQEKDTKKLGELAQRLIELEKQLGSEYVALVDALRRAWANWFPSGRQRRAQNRSIPPHRASADFATPRCRFGLSFCRRSRPYSDPPAWG